VYVRRFPRREGTYPANPRPRPPSVHVAERPPGYCFSLEDSQNQRHPAFRRPALYVFLRFLVHVSHSFDLLVACLIRGFNSQGSSIGRSYRLFNVIDDFNREGLAIEADFSPPSERVIRVLEQVMEWRGKPTAIQYDNGPEYVSHLCRLGRRKTESVSTTFSRESLKRTLMWSDTTVLCALTGWGSTCLKISTRSGPTPPSGSGLITTNGPTWVSVASPRGRN
jgi:transposase InsO family protein